MLLLDFYLFNIVCNKFALHVHFAKNKNIPMPSCYLKKDSLPSNESEDFGKNLHVSWLSWVYVYDIPNLGSKIYV